MTIRDTLSEDAAAVAALIDSVARERRYLAATVGFSAESTQAFIASLRSANGVHILAVIGGAVVGWCDITPLPYEGMKHVGRLGMGVKSGFRGKGTGKRLLKAALLRGFNTGLERVELEVFGSNREAVRLYESFGFVREGRKIAARKLDGISDDLLLYATFKKG